MRNKLNPVTPQSPDQTVPVNDHLAAQAPHLALQAPHFGMLLEAPHLLLLQAPHIMAQPPSAAVVTTAMARALVRVDDSEFMVRLLKVKEKVTCKIE